MMQVVFSVQNTNTGGQVCDVSPFSRALSRRQLTDGWRLFTRLWYLEVLIVILFFTTECPA